MYQIGYALGSKVLPIFAGTAVESMQVSWRCAAHNRGISTQITPSITAHRAQSLHITSVLTLLLKFLATAAYHTDPTQLLWTLKVPMIYMLRDSQVLRIIMWMVRVIFYESGGNWVERWLCVFPLHHLCVHPYLGCLLPSWPSVLSH